MLHVSLKFEDGVDVTESTLIDSFQQAGYLLLESTEEQRVLLEERNNHLGIGVASN